MKRSIDGDIEVSLKDGKLCVESVVLRLASPVFESMLSAEMKESSEWKICLPDYDVNCFKDFYELLLPVSTKKLDYGTVTKIIVIAKKYCVDSLVEKCANFIIHNIQTFDRDRYQNLGTLFAFAKKYDLKEVSEACLTKVIEQNAYGTFFLNPIVYDAFEDSDLMFEAPCGRILHEEITKVFKNVPIKIPTLNTKQAAWKAFGHFFDLMFTESASDLHRVNITMLRRTTFCSEGFELNEHGDIKQW